MISGYMAVLFNSIGLMPFLASPLDNAHPLFVVIITPGFCPHHVKVADEDPDSGSQYANDI